MTRAIALFAPGSTSNATSLSAFLTLRSSLRVASASLRVLAPASFGPTIGGVDLLSGVHDPVGPCANGIEVALFASHFFTD